MNASIHPADTAVSIQDHSLRLSMLLHLLPGAVATVAYLVLAPIGERLGLPSFLMLMVAAVFFALSFELGCLLREGWKRNSSFSLRGVVMYREPLPAWQAASSTAMDAGKRMRMVATSRPGSGRSYNMRLLVAGLVHRQAFTQGIAVHPPVVADDGVEHFGQSGQQLRQLLLLYAR